MKTEIFIKLLEFLNFFWKVWNFMKFLKFLKICKFFENFKILWNFMKFLKFVLKFWEICWNFGKSAIGQHSTNSVNAGNKRMFSEVNTCFSRSILTRIIQSLYYAPVGRHSDSADRGRSIIRVKSIRDFSSQYVFLRKNMWLFLGQ
jgi:hypothetical protein